MQWAIYSELLVNSVSLFFPKKKEKSLEKNERLFCFVNTNILARSLNLHPLKNKLKRRGARCFWSVFSQLEPIDRE